MRGAHRVGIHAPGSRRPRCRRLLFAYLSNGTAKIEILGGSAAEPHARIDSLDDSFGVEEYHHFCLNVADVDATLAELRSRGVEVLGDAIDLEAIGRRLGFFKDNNDNVIELASPLR